MKQSRSKQILSMILALVMVITTLAVPSVAAKEDPVFADGAFKAINDPENGVVVVSEEAKKAGSEEVTILVGVAQDTLYMQTGDLKLAASGYGDQMSLYAKAESRIESALAESVEIETRYSLLFNGFTFTGEKWMVDAINQIDGLVAFQDFAFELVEPASQETVTVTPSMEKSTTNTGAVGAWAKGYTGAGTVVAVIDSGIRKTHEAFSVAPANPKMDQAYVENVLTEYAGKLHGGDMAQLYDIYYSEKIPFSWDYVEGDGDPQHTATDHGTHVSAIAAGNNGVDFKGVAPDAQIVSMGVFDDNGSAYFTDLMAAMEDCVYLGVDAINMSLGVTAYFTAYEAIDAYMDDVYAALEDAGISVVVAAGNDNNASLWNNYSLSYDKAGANGMWPMTNLDNGVVGAPATFPGSLAVASVQNSVSIFGSMEMTYDGTVYDVVPYPNEDISNLSGSYELVWVGTAVEANLAELERQGISLEGKIALCSRNDISASEKCANVANAGAVACILMNSIPGSIWETTFEGSVPRGMMTNEVGQALLNAMNGTEDVYYSEIALGLTGTVVFSKTANYNDVTPSRFSSWGTTAGLEIKPEVSAPGGSITSAIGFGEDNSYQAWDGTSMATPHVAGGILLVKQALRERYPEADATQINSMAYNYLLSTAHGVDNQFVRKQGAGMIDLAAAVSSEVYASVNGGRPQLELDDSTTGEFSMEFQVHNDGKTDRTYNINLHVMTLSVQHIDFTGYRENFGYTEEKYREFNQKYHYFLSNDEAVSLPVTQGNARDVTREIEVYGNTTVTVKAGETATVSLSIVCSASLMDWFETYCPVGNYLEGFVRLDDADGGTDLSLPFLGYVGDWDYVPMFDDGFWWQIPYGQTNPAQSTEAQGTFVGYGAMEQGLGLNNYASMKGKTYLADRNAISPNGDGILDAADSLQFALMRNPKNLKVYLEDEKGNVLETFFDENYYYRKEFYTSGLNGGTSFSTMEIDYDWSGLEENQTVYLVMEAWLDDRDEYTPEDNFNGQMKFPITIDTVAPKIIPEFYSSTEAVNMAINVVDDNYVAYYAIYADAECTQLLYENSFFAANRNNWECSFNNEWRDTEYRTEYYVFAADYAGNEEFVKCSYEGKMIGTVTELELSACPKATKSREIVARQMVNWNTGNYEYAFVEMNSNSGSKKEQLNAITYSNPEYDAGWGWDFTSAAIRYDGTVFINSFRKLAILDPETYEVTYVANFNNEKCAYEPSVRAVLSHPDSGEIYAFSYINAGAADEAYSGEYFCKVDTETGYMTPLWEIQEYSSGAADVWHWAYTFIDGDTIAIFGHNGKLWLVEFETGNLIEEIDLPILAPNGESMWGIHGTGGNMLYDDTTNTLLIYSNWSWLRYNHYNTGGYISYNLDTGELLMHRSGAGAGYTVYGLYFQDQLGAKPWYYVMELIDAIDDANGLEEMKAAIDAAREAYDALPEEEKPYIANYQDLLDAELEYLILLAQIHADGAAAAAAEAAELAEQAAEAAAEAAELAERYPSAQEPAAEVTEAAARVAQAAQEAAAAAEAAAEAAANGDVKGASEAEDEALAALERAREALAEVLAALEATREAAANDTTLQDAKDEALKKLEEYDDTEGYSDHQLEDHEAALEDAREAIENAETVEEILEIIAELEDRLEQIAASCPAKDFTDVDLDSWYHESVDFVVLTGLMEGVGEGRFAPNAALTRAQLVTILYRMAGEPSVRGMRQPFQDVIAGQWYSDAIIWAYNAGIVKGLSDTVFGVNVNITREQVATILYRYANGEKVETDVLAGYADAAQVSAWAVDAMNWAVANGLINGVSDVTLAPGATSTRAQFATILMRGLTN